MNGEIRRPQTFLEENLYPSGEKGREGKEKEWVSIEFVLYLVCLVFPVCLLILFLILI